MRINAFKSTYCPGKYNGAEKGFDNSSSGFMNELPNCTVLNENVEI
jgi:hypothetical protein